MDITTRKIFDGSTISASGNDTSDALNVQGIANDGVFSVYIYETGSGTGRWTYLLSANGVDYVEFTDAADIISNAFVSTSGPGSDGKDIIQFSPELAPFIRIKVLETGGASSVKPVAYLIIK